MARFAQILGQLDRGSQQFTVEALATALPQDWVVDAVVGSARKSVRERRLPAVLTLWVVILLGLFRRRSYVELLEMLLEQSRWARDRWVGGVPPSTSAITQARDRLGVEPAQALFELSAPRWKAMTPGLNFCGLRVHAMDGTTFKTPDTPANLAHFGLPRSSRGRSAYSWHQSGSPMKQPRNTQSLSALFAQLGTPLRNVRNSWCAYSPEKRRAVFTVWADLLLNGRYVFWHTAGARHQSLPGASEMRRIVLEVMESGSEALGVLCYAEDAGAVPRVRDRFVEDTLHVLRLAEEPDGLVGYVQGEAPIADALRGAVARVAPMQSAIDDLDEPPPGFDTPGRVQRLTQGYRRDDAVRAFVIARAAGKCEHCGKVDFLVQNGVPYVEAHHIISLSKQGPDTVHNVIALCAGHHREAHYGQDALRLEQEFLRMLERLNAGGTSR